MDHGLRFLPRRDPYFGNVVLLMHFDSDKQFGVARDEKKHVFTFAGADPTPSPSPNLKFGASGIQAGGARSNWIETGPSADWAFGSAPATVEFFCYGAAAGLNNSATPISNETPGAQTWSFRYEQLAGTLRFVGLGFTSAAVNFALGAWHHIAATRDAAHVFRIFVDGVLGFEAGVPGGAGTAWGNAANKLLITSSLTDVEWGPRGGGLTGNAIDELRITKGFARYTANFTPPPLPFPDE